jgi:hypothetical protein
LAKASRKVLSDFRKSKFYPFKFDLPKSALVAVMVFWYQLKLGFHFPGVLSTEKCAQAANEYARLGRTSLMNFRLKFLSNKKP